MLAIEKRISTDLVRSIEPMAKFTLGTLSLFVGTVGNVTLLPNILSSYNKGNVDV